MGIESDLWLAHQGDATIEANNDDIKQYKRHTKQHNLGHWTGSDLTTTAPQTNRSLEAVALGKRFLKLGHAVSICIVLMSALSTISHLAIVNAQQLTYSDRILPNKIVTLVGNLHNQPKQRISSSSLPVPYARQHNARYHNDNEEPTEGIRQTVDIGPIDDAINDGQVNDNNDRYKHVKRRYRDANELIEDTYYGSNYLTTGFMDSNPPNGSLTSDLADGSVHCSNFRVDPITNQVICVGGPEHDGHADYEDSTGLLGDAPVGSVLRIAEPRQRPGAVVLPLARLARRAEARWPQKVRRSDRQMDDLQRAGRAGTYRVNAEQLKRFLIAQQSIIDPYGQQFTRTSSPPFILTPAADEATDSAQPPQQQQQSPQQQQDTDGSPSARKREQHSVEPSNSVAGGPGGGAQVTGALGNVVVGGGSATSASAGPIDAATDMASETPLECQMRQFSFTATKTDPRTGNTCSGMIVANICYGACDTGEIADWLFPHKKSIHKVCRHGARVRRRALLTECTGEDVDESTRDYHYVDARSCVCQKCTSADTACLGSLTRPYLPQGGGPAATTTTTKLATPTASTTSSNELSQSAASGSLVSGLGGRYGTSAAAGPQQQQQQ